MGAGMQNEKVRRRLSAILAADVAGYSRLMEHDEAGTLSRLRSIHQETIGPRVEHYEGRIVKTTGDGFLIEFASALAAVSCALDLQADMETREATLTEVQRIRFRIGINLGDVIHEGGDVFGDGVNIAARLEQMAEPGSICVSRNVFEQIRGRLAIEYDELGEQQVKNLTRLVEAYRLRPGGGYTVATLSVGPPRHRRRSVIAMVACLALLGMGFLWWSVNWSSLPGAAAPEAQASQSDRETPRLSIVVLPFTNLSDDKDQEYLADGITDDLITDLSRISGSFVIARNTSFTYRGKSVDTRKVGEELGIRYVLEGSVRRAGTQLRVNAQLIEAATSAHIWAERFDRETQDIFALQSEITGRIARALNLELMEAESRRLGQSGNMEASDLALRGWIILLNKPQTAETNRAAEPLIEQAIALDETSALAWTAATYLHTRAGNFGWSESSAASLRKAVDAGERAIQLAPRSSDAHYMLGYALRSSGQQDRALAAMDMAIALNPNNPLPYHGLAYGMILLGRAQEGIPFLERAFRLSPREPLGAVWHWTAAYAHVLTGADELAVTASKNALAVNPKFPRSYETLAAASAHLGRDREARAAIAEYLKYAPRIDTVSKARQNLSLSDHPTYQKQLDRFADGLRKAGLPD
ncbi:MAG: tetratricopeptide repeat protein [Enhydrobacter sp.]|nr:MAG: tetratricopeptide repeat protein [Enhydrobacter sp.]